MSLFKLSSILLLPLLSICSAVTIPPTGPGGYENLVVAISDSFLPPDVAAEQEFIKKIKELISGASRSLYDASDRYFYFKDVKILIPSTWQGAPGTDYDYSDAIDESFSSSDIRVFEFKDYIAPFTQKVSYCGSQGQYIFLSPEYISRWTEQKNPSKVVVQEWSIYRWGLFEEYGIVRDGTQSFSRFPTIEATSDNTAEWKATGCSDKPMTGKFGYYDYDLSGNPIFNEGCSLSFIDYCSFLPDEIQSANTSLLYLSYLDSVNHFCDDETHDKTSKNRHNYFCNELSAWQMIKNHPDYRGRSPILSFPGDPTFSVVKPAFRTPVVYILVDTSSENAASNVFAATKDRLRNWVSSSLPKTVLVGLGEFGGNSTYDNGLPFRYMTNILSPGPVSAVSGQFGTAINSMEQNKLGGILLDKAIGDAAVFLTSRLWQQGSIVLLIKFTSSNDAVKAELPEGPIIDILTSRQVKLFSIEYGFSGVEQANFANLASRSMGKAYVGSSSNSFNTELDTLLNDVLRIVTDRTFELSRIIEVGHEEFLIPPGGLEQSTFQTFISDTPYVDFEFYAPAGSSLEIEVTPAESPMLVSKVDGTSWNLNQWDRFYLNITKSEQMEISRASWCYSIRNTGQEEVKVHALSRHLRNEDPPGLGGPTKSGAIHECELWTSDVNNVAAVSTTPYRPFGIFAYFFNGLNVVRGLEVYATITQPNGAQTRIKLYDERPSGPLTYYDIDIEDNDGVYSNIFSPTEKGMHHISIEALSPKPPECSFTNTPSAASLEVQFVQQQQIQFVQQVHGKAVLPNQDSPYPPFGSTGARSAFFQRYYPYYRSVDVQFSSFRLLPPRVLVLNAEAGDTPSIVRMTFVEPHLYDGAETPSGYAIRYSTNRADLIRPDGSIAFLETEVRPEDIVSGSLGHNGSGVSGQVEFTVYSNESQVFYFVMASTLNASRIFYGQPSPIVSTMVTPTVLQTTTSTTTTPETTTTQSTTTEATTTVTTPEETSTVETTVPQTTVTNTLRPIVTTTKPTPTEEPENSGGKFDPYFYIIVLISLALLQPHIYE